MYITLKIVKKNNFFINDRSSLLPPLKETFLKWTKCNTEKGNNIREENSVIQTSIGGDRVIYHYIFVIVQHLVLPNNFNSIINFFFWEHLFTFN